MSKSKHYKVILSEDFSSAKDSKYNTQMEGFIELTIKSDLQVGNLCVYEKYYKHGTYTNYIKETCYVKSIVNTIKGKVINVSPVYAIDYNNNILDKAYYKKYGYTLIYLNGNWKEIVTTIDGTEDFVFSSDTICERISFLENGIPVKRIYVENGSVIEGYTQSKYETFETKSLPDWCVPSNI